MFRTNEERRSRRSVAIYVFGFLLIVGLAFWGVVDGGVTVWAGSARAEPNGTVPGTLPEPVRAKVTFVHAAPFATPTDATAIDLCSQADAVIDDMTGIVFQQVEPLIIDPGTYSWKIALSNSSCADVLLHLPELKLAPGSHTLVVITGDGVNYPIDSVVTTLNPGGVILYFPIMAYQEE